MIGTRGVPAHYGGFETAVEEVGRRLVERGHRVRVYCRRGNAEGDPTEHLGMELVTLPVVKRRSLETLAHTALSTAHLLRHRTDVAFVFNSANAPLLPLIRAARIPVATHVDGLEWKRAKWGPVGQRYYRLAERASVLLSDALIADAQGIADYYQDKFGALSDLISYGAPVLGEASSDRLPELGLQAQGYHLVVARMEPENHVHVIVEGYVQSSARRPLVVVGSAPYADEYIARTQQLAAGDDRVRFVGGVYDQELLDQLYAGALTYLHGHSVGGTNPSLLRAIGAGTATLAYDVNFNREVLREDGGYFGTAADLSGLLDRAEAEPAAMAVRGQRLAARARDYDWDDVAQAYESLATRLHRPRGR
ncbi:DUF1972 domain-containing protein [Auraticoccus monumenti]|uniref:Glycosyltransferase involved in cell wall bisynthesis n=1 Tax=Auraticoccus monumenti TaxID=675864 RepID=A0A1G6VWG1_9ACTN|nr:DUF1972 domain-containing protein [Auraticoccus monumenti]SDD57317.1 Glycosyltransferase involved in cell wall bisynthesis [Auraticoccus monumenti]